MIVRLVRQMNYALGITSIVVSHDVQELSILADMSYLMAGILTPAQWKGLYTGKVAWTSPKVVAQLTKWASLPKQGCTNKDVLTKTNILGAFTKGQAAMISDGSWDAATYQKAMGKKVAPFALPFTNSGKNVVQYDPPIPGTANSARPAAAITDPAVSGRRLPTLATRPPDHRERTNIRTGNGRRAPPAAVAE